MSHYRASERHINRRRKMGVSKGGGGSRKGPRGASSHIMGGGPSSTSPKSPRYKGRPKGDYPVGSGYEDRADKKAKPSVSANPPKFHMTDAERKAEKKAYKAKSGPVKTYSAEERAELQRQMFGGDKKKGRKATQSSDASKTPGETKGKRTGPAKGSSKASKAAATRAKNKAAAAKKGRGPKTVEARREGVRKAGKAGKTRTGRDLRTRVAGHSPSSASVRGLFGTKSR